MKIICVEIIEAYKAILECEKHGALADTHVRFVLFRSIGSYITIRICAFLEEYNYQLVLVDDDELKNMVASFKAICQPVISSILEWKDLRKYRNHILAHSYREKNKDKTSNSVLTRMATYDVPKNIHDLHFLCECMNIIDWLFEGFEKVFGKEFYLKDMDRGLHDIPPRMNEANSEVRISKLRAEVNAEILKIKSHYGVN